MLEVNYVVKQIQMSMNVHHDKVLFHAKNYKKKIISSINYSFFIFISLLVHIEVEPQEYEE